MSQAPYFALNKDGSKAVACSVDSLVYHVPAGLACAVSALCALTSRGRKSLIGVGGYDGRGKGDLLGLLIKMLKFEFAKSSSLFLEKLCQ